MKNPAQLIALALSCLGVIVGFAAIIGGNYLEGGHLSALVNIPAAVIVTGGTIGAAMLQTPWDNLKRALDMLVWVIAPPQIGFERGINRIVQGKFWIRLCLAMVVDSNYCTKIRNPICCIYSITFGRCPKRKSPHWC